MRIITGRYKGFHLKMPPTNGVRPTTDRVKESIFNIIMNLKSFNEACVLDLYAGSGSLGFESLSRGAARVVFVDKSPVCIRTLKENIATLHGEDSCSLVKHAAASYLMRTEDVFDFIFIDPPYASREYESLTSIILERHLLAPDGLMFVKFSSKVDLHLSEEWREVTKRVFGETTFSFHAQSSSGVFS